MQSWQLPAESGLRLHQPSRGYVCSTGSGSFFPLGESARFGLAAGSALQIETKLDRVVEHNRDGEISRGFRLDSNDPAASSHFRPRLGKGGNANSYVDLRALRNQKRAREQDSAHADVLRAGVHFFVGQRERDGKVQRIASAAPFLGFGGFHLQRLSRVTRLQQVTVVHISARKRTKGRGGNL